MFNALLFGSIAGSSIFLGALIGLFVPVKKMGIAAIMAFGSGVLISALSIDLMEEAHSMGGILWVSLGFILGGLFFVAGDYLVDNSGGHYRKSTHGKHHTTNKKSNVQNISGTAMLLGALLDGIPESAAIGMNSLNGASMGLLLVVAVFLSNIPEGISGSLGMKQAGKSRSYILWIWFAVVIASGLASLIGFQFLGYLPEHYKAFAMAFAAGAILAMITDTMIPEAFENGGRFIAMMAITGFLVAFIISRLANA